LHSCGLVHGDIKPENILLFDREGVLTAAVGDLGTCGASSQVSGNIPGSIQYDVYNFGLLLWSILTSCKERPFPSGTQFEIQHDYDKARGSLLSRIPRERMIASFHDSINACVHPDPAERPSIFEVLPLLDPVSSTRYAETLVGPEIDEIC
jgi:serine/threonine protein kinase